MKKSKALKNIIGRLVENSFKDGKIQENQVTIAIRVLKSQPLADSIFALSQYLKGIKRIERMHTMYIETVIPLSPIQIQKMKKIAEKKATSASRQVKITKVVTQVNPEILGGFKLRVGDEIWDESILNKVTQVKEVIISGGSN